jgi:hypothetical protein
MIKIEKVGPYDWKVVEEEEAQIPCPHCDHGRAEDDWGNHGFCGYCGGTGIGTPLSMPSGVRWPSPALFEEYYWSASGNSWTKDVMDPEYFIDLMTRIPNQFSKEVVPT